jgi:hypothetical protein
VFVFSPTLVGAHNVSIIRTDAIVRRDRLELTLRVLPEDVLFSAGPINVVTGRIAKADVLRGIQAHPGYLLDGLIILDDDGHRLSGKVTSIDLPPLIDDTILMDNLLATSIVYRVEYPLAKPPTRLSFRQHFNVSINPTPVMTVLTVTREGLNSSTMMQVPDGENSETVAFDWTEASTSSTGTVTTVTPLSSFDVTDTYLYIQNEEVRVEILMPLTTLETRFPIKRANPEILEPLEQVKPRLELEKFFASQNELKIDGLVVKPRLERYDFYGLDYRDFSVRPERKRLNAASARLGAILTYSTKGAPRHVEFTWTLFNPREPTVRVVVFAYDKGSRLLFQPDKPTFVWDNPGEPSLPKIDAVPIHQTAADDGARAALSETLLRNVYRGFDYRSETDIYEALAQSVQGELLTDLYLKIKQGLTLQEQGGAVARVNKVTVTKSEPAAGQIKGGFVERVTWQVEGTVEHWGHIHTRVNEYTADLGIAPSHGAWKINSMDVVKQSQVSSAVSIRRL